MFGRNEGRYRKASGSGGALLDRPGGGKRRAAIALRRPARSLRGYAVIHPRPGGIVPTLWTLKDRPRSRRSRMITDRQHGRRRKLAFAKLISERLSNFCLCDPRLTLGMI
jgi:hypothetical protein